MTNTESDTDPEPGAASAPKSYHCRHILTTGHAAAQSASAGSFCFYNHTARPPCSI